MNEISPSPAKPLEKWLRNFGFSIGLLLVVFAGVITGHGYVVLIVVLLALMIMLHEFGHLVAAKLSGMTVTEYFVGFGPKIWSTKIHETEYGVKAFLAGGYVKIPGMTNIEQVPESLEPLTYRNASTSKKLIVVSAGSIVHFVIALVLLWIALTFIGVPSGNSVNVQALSPLASGADPARAAGLKPNDIIESVQGHSIHSFGQLVSSLHGEAGKVVTITVLRGPKRLNLHVRPIEVGGGGKIGILVGTPSVTSSALGSIPRSFRWVGHYLSVAANSLGTTLSSTWNVLIHPSVSSHSVINDQRAMSIVGAARIASEAARTGPGPVLLIFVELNLFIGIFNMLPLPILDGSHFAIALYEKIRSLIRNSPYRADFSKLIPLSYIMMTVFVILGVSLIYLDIVKPINIPFR